MIGEAVGYAASRAASEVAEPVARWLLWGSAAVLLLIGAFAFGLVATYWYLAEQYGSLAAAGFTAIGCLILALVALAIPPLISWYNRHFDTRPDTATATIEAVQQEAREVVDYFGAAKVMATAFMFGLGAARRVRRS